MPEVLSNLSVTQWLWLSVGVSIVAWGVHSKFPGAAARFSALFRVSPKETHSDVNTLVFQALNLARHCNECGKTDYAKTLIHDIIPHLLDHQQENP